MDSLKNWASIRFLIPLIQLGQNKLSRSERSSRAGPFGSLENYIYISPRRQFDELSLNVLKPSIKPFLERYLIKWILAAAPP